MKDKDSNVNERYRSRDWFLLFFKGMAMGAADVVPGVSGGTIAFISGIYGRLLGALKSLTPIALITLFKEGFKAFWQEIDGRFLLTLLSGVLLSVVTLAKFISSALQEYPILIWAFFFGLVVASIIYMAMQVLRWRWQELAALVIGAVIALTIVSLRPAQLPAQWWMLFFSGAIAICAMILPGISGSFILLLLGMYKVFIDALNSLDFVLLISFVLGCILGLLGFSHLLSWLLKRYQMVMYTLLTGFLVGSLKVLWPWKQVLETTVDRHGESIPLVQINILPTTYSQITGEPAFLWPAILVALFGLVLVLFLERMGDKA